MSFGGPIDSMIRSYKANVRLLTGRKRLKDIQAEYPSSKTRSSLDFNAGPHQTQSQINRFHEQIRRQRKANRFRFLLILGLTLIFVLVILYFVITADYSNLIEVIE